MSDSPILYVDSWDTKFTKPRCGNIFDEILIPILPDIKKKLFKWIYYGALLIYEKVSWELEKLSSYISSMIKCRSLKVKCHIFSPVSCNCWILKYICCRFLPISISISNSPAWLAFKKIFIPSLEILNFNSELLDRKPVIDQN